VHAEQTRKPRSRPKAKLVIERRDFHRIGNGRHSSIACGKRKLGSGLRGDRSDSRDFRRTTVPLISVAFQPMLVQRPYLSN